MVIDPIFSVIFTIFFVIFWGTSSLKKACKPVWFKAVLIDYNIFPKFMIPVLVFMVPAVELFIAIAFIFMPIVGLSMSILLLCVYALILTFNTLRGHSIADCGCSWGGEGAGAGIGELSPKYFITRNVLIALAGLLVLIPVNTRKLNLFDAVNIGFAILAFVGLAMALRVVFKNYIQMKGVYHV